MAVIPIVWGQLGIATTAYSGLMAFTLPEAVGQRVTHIPPNSTTFPTKELGHLPGTVSGVIRLTATSVAAFIAAVRTGTAERKISFLLGAVEHYVYSYSGDVGAITCFNPHRDVTRLYDIAFSFPMSKSGVYVSSTDAVAWGS